MKKTRYRTETDVPTRKGQRVRWKHKHPAADRRFPWTLATFVRMDRGSRITAVIKFDHNRVESFVPLASLTRVPGLPVPGNGIQA